MASSITKIQVRRDTGANWTVSTVKLASGEFGYDTTNDILKIGNDSDVWADLPQIGGNFTSINTSLIPAPETLDAFGVC